MTSAAAYSTSPSVEAIHGHPSSASSLSKESEKEHNNDSPALTSSDIRNVFLRPSPYDHLSDDWRDWLRSEEYVDAWASSSSWAGLGESSVDGVWRGLENLDFTPLDVSTRYLLELLDDTAEGVRRGRDRATTERCNRVRKDKETFYGLFLTNNGLEILMETGVR